jgi:hypothetical protein
MARFTLGQVPSGSNRQRMGGAGGCSGLVTERRMVGSTSAPDGRRNGRKDVAGSP